ncbi:MAG: D-alanyl-D-alanine carboxypeptidase/D-alanyl-D-alanine-endopeptidase [Myxococcota bacterium]
MRRIVLFMTLVLAIAGAPGPGARPASAEAVASDLAARLDRLIARERPLARASVGMLVVRASDGEVVYARGADRQLIPASNQKILTALAALSRFGPTHAFTTRIWSNAPPDADGLVDTLLIEGGGDPATNSEDWWRLAADLRRKGLRGVRGDLRIDDSLFDGPGWHPSWGKVSSRAYHAPVGALTANYGAFVVAIGPAKAVGVPAQVTVDPPVDYLRVRNRATTGKPGGRARLSVDRARGRRDEGPADEIVVVDGTARLGDDLDEVHKSVIDPGLYAGAVLAYQLEANEVFVDGDVARAPRAEGEIWHLLHEHAYGRRVDEIVKLFMKYSNNSIGEALLKNLAVWDGVSLDGAPARQGDWPGGVKALRRQMGILGVDLGDANLVDGSGLSTKNRLSPRTLVRALQVGRTHFSLAPEFMASMPIAQLDGTLEKRLPGRLGRIRAKTGLLADAASTSLSGYAERDDGETLVFSILVNGFTGGAGRAMDSVDRLAGALLEAPRIAVKAD